MSIHPTAVIGPDVVLGKGVTIHPYAVLDGKITVGDGCEIGPFVHLTGWVTIGRNTRIYAGAAIGTPPQDYSFDGTPGLVEIGENCILREYVTVHTPVHGGEGEKTMVGDNCFLMANAHVAHNAKLGKNVVMANGCLLAGYVEVEDFAFLSGNSAVHQHCRVGAYAMVGGLSKVVQDVPPYVLCDGSPAVAHGLNVVGLRRRGFTAEQRSMLKQLYKTLYSGVSLAEAIARMKGMATDPLVAHFVQFVEKAEKRGIISASE